MLAELAVVQAVGRLPLAVWNWRRQAAGGVPWGELLADLRAESGAGLTLAGANGAADDAAAPGT